MITNIQLENQYKSSATSIFALLEELYEPYVFEVYTRALDEKMRHHINTAIKQHYPLINVVDGVTFQITEGKDIRMYLTKALMAELTQHYPEALI